MDKVDSNEIRFYMDDEGKMVMVYVWLSVRAKVDDGQRRRGAREEGSGRAKTLVGNIHSAEINLHSAEITVENIHCAKITGGETRPNWLLIAAQPN